MRIGIRLEQYIKEIGSSSKDFAEAINYNNKTLGNVLKGTTETPSSDLIAKLVKHHPRLNLHWLFFNEGNMLLDDEQFARIRRANMDWLINELREKYETNS